MDWAVVDASVAIKWVYSEELSSSAIALRTQLLLTAPDILLAECANILWKKVRRGELDPQEAILSASALRRSGVELVAGSDLVEGALALSVELDHPAYDCFYLELSRSKGLPLVTADARLIRKLAQSSFGRRLAMISLSDISPS